MLAKLALSQLANPASPTPSPGAHPPMASSDSLIFVKLCYGYCEKSVVRTRRRPCPTQEKGRQRKGTHSARSYHAPERAEANMGRTFSSENRGQKVAVHDATPCTLGRGDPKELDVLPPGLPLPPSSQGGDLLVIFHLVLGNSRHANRTRSP